MALSEAQKFLGVENVTCSTLRAETKCRLLGLAKTLQLTLPDKMRKDEVILAVVKHLKLPEIEFDSLEMAKIQLQIKQMEHQKELKQLEYESEGEEKEREGKKREENETEREERRKERIARAEQKDKEREIELQKMAMKYDNQLKLADIKGNVQLDDSGEDSEKERHSRRLGGNLFKYVQALPRFDEKEVEAFFISFEKVAKQMKWSQDMWALLIQTKLAGRASEVFASLPEEVSGTYEEVKKSILSAYELVSEACKGLEI
ncbi:uncharacterized protein [Scyliorhinus torazame]|uniref:uncharacterized protein n=1 Tax=Scyliorhinus torazame TaxID=75743 RepID=UPI003B5C56A6